MTLRPSCPIPLILRRSATPRHPGRSFRGRLTSLTLALLLTATGTLGIAPAAHAGPAAATTTEWRFLDVPGHDGVRLRANLIAPRTAGPHPAIVFISSWGLNDAEYLVQAQRLAAAGYVVLSYTPRGFWASGGQIETAGPPDIADASTVLDWLIASTSADPNRIGLGGVSYGAGISLLAASQDSRVRAVAAMSTWTDLVASLYGDQTRRPQAVWLLRLTAELFGRPSAEFDRIVDDYFANRNVPQVQEWGQIRSPATYLTGLNANAPAVLIANAYGDSLFPPNQLVDLFTRFTGPKRLELAPGDHAIPELTGLIGLPNQVWSSTRAWFDRYLADGSSATLDGGGAGVADGPVVLRVRNNPDVVESYRDWSDVTGSTVRYHLGDVPWHGTGPLTTEPALGWSTSIRAVGDTVAGGGVPLLTNGLEPLTGVPATAWLPAVDRHRGAVWCGAPLPARAALRGIPKLRLSVTPSAASGTVVAYLYDLDSLGMGRLITHAPVTWTDASPGTPLELTLALPATAWDVPAGHRIALVVDTEDPLYLDANPYGATISVHGGSWLDLPLR